MSVCVRMRVYVFVCLCGSVCGSGSVCVFVRSLVCACFLDKSLCLCILCFCLYEHDARMFTFYIPLYYNVQWLTRKYSNQ